MTSRKSAEPDDAAAGRPQAWDEPEPGVPSPVSMSSEHWRKLERSGALTTKLDFEDVKVDVLNVVPPQRAGLIAERLGLITANNRWSGVHWLTMESARIPGVHGLEDATLAALAMPKAGHMANQHAKVCAAAVTALIRNRPVNLGPVLESICYSVVDDRNAGRIASVFAYDAAQKAMLPSKAGSEILEGGRGGRHSRDVLGENYLGRYAGMTVHWVG